MANLKAHLLNFHKIASHVEIVVENTSTEPHTYYRMNRWDKPEEHWSSTAGEVIAKASSQYSFDIEENPEEIISKWKTYWEETNDSASYLGNNCAVAVQWFLSEFANIPQPNTSNMSSNHVLLGLLWPSFIPCPVMLPGRVMSNATFYLEARNHPGVANYYATWFLHASIALSAIVFTASTAALGSALLVDESSSPERNLFCAAAACLSPFVFFKANNLLSAKKIAEQTEVSERSKLLG